MKYREAAQSALDVQNAVNLSGVVRTFHLDVLPALWEAAGKLGKGTDWVNRHPVVTVFLSKICDLNGQGFSDGYSLRNALAEVDKILADNLAVETPA